MVGPARKREAVAHACQRLNASERRACRTLGQARSSQRYQATHKDEGARLTEAILRIAARETRAGYRGVRRHLRKEGWNVNLKRVHRIWKKEGLRVPPRARKKRRLGTSENGAQRLKAEQINHVWSYDFVFDQTESDGRLKTHLSASILLILRDTRDIGNKVSLIGQVDRPPKDLVSQ
jgi:transposase InsO family protein